MTTRATQCLSDEVPVGMPKAPVASQSLATALMKTRSYFVKHFVCS